MNKGAEVKKNLYLILSVLFIVSVLSTAAICNLGENLSSGILENKNVQNDGQSKSSTDDSKKDSTDSNSSGSVSTDSDSNDNKDSKNPSNTQNNPPLINSIKLDSDIFFPNLQYKLTCDVTDPDNNTIFYDWHVDAGSIDSPESSTAIWTTPASNGLYDIILTVSDGWGGSDSMTETIPVGGVPKNAAPVIDEIAVYPDGSKYTEDTYEIWCLCADPNNSIINFDFKITGGTLHDQDANIIKWDTPNAPGTYTVTVTVADKEGNTTTSPKDIVVEQSRVEITDIIVQIDYIAVNSSYYIKGVIVDPKSKINQYLWSTTGGNIVDENGPFAVWQTPDNPGKYSLKLTAHTFGGDTISIGKEFTVKPSQ